MLTINTNKPYKIFAEVLEQGALEQFESAMQQDFVVQGALMPDAHTGYSLPIGAVVATEGVVVPAWVGYDIGCGMCAMPTTFKAEEVRQNAKAIFDEIYKAVPVGFNHNQKPVVWEEALRLDCTPFLAELFNRSGLLQLGTLGGGNHFAEVGEDEKGIVWIVIHSGSRNLGHSVAAAYMRLASGSDKPKEGHYGLHVDSALGRDYIKDLNFCLAFALQNRKTLIYRIINAMRSVVCGAGMVEMLINRNHNHAELRNGLWIHRKGATHAEEGMYGVIPGNMRDGSFIVRGLGNPNSLYSSSHGAGRVLGRKEAHRVLDMDKFTETMSGVTALVTKETLDESPFAYKNIFDVMAQQTDLVKVLAHVKPIINVKG